MDSAPNLPPLDPQVSPPDLSPVVVDDSPKGRSPPRKRFFTWTEKEECWSRAPFMYGRDPDRWRLDAYGNPVNKFMKGCFGVFCYEYDHIVPFSKGGLSTVDNCQILNTYLNRVKSNRTNLGYVEFKKGLPEFDWSEPELDVVERAVFGNVSKPELGEYVRRRGGEKLDPAPTLLKDPFVRQSLDEPGPTPSVV